MRKIFAGALVSLSACVSLAGPPAMAAGDNPADETGLVAEFNEEQLEDAMLEPSDAEGAEIRQDLVESSERLDAVALEAEEIDVASIGDGSIQVASAESTDLQGMQFAAHREADGSTDLSVEFEAGPSEENLEIMTSGPGMGTWGSRTSGQYLIKMYSPSNKSLKVMDGTFLWNREKLLNDGDGAFTYWTYSRKGIGQAVNIPGDNWQIKTLRIQSYPYDSIEDGLENWTEVMPDTSFTGTCSSHRFDTNINLGTSFGGVSFGYSFQDCDRYTKWHNPDKPGSYHLTMDQGNVVREGDRAAAYTVGWKSHQGTPGSMHDFQRLVITRGPDGTSGQFRCESYEISEQICRDW